MSRTEAAVAGGTRTQDEGARGPARGPRRGVVPPPAAHWPAAVRPAGVDRHPDHDPALDGRDPRAGGRRAPGRDPARPERRYRKPPRRAAGLREPRALLPDRRPDDGRRRRQERPRRTAGPDDPRARARPKPDRLSAARPLVPRHDLPAALGDDALGHPHPHLRRGVHPGPGPARCGHGQGGHAGALVDQPTRVDLAPDRRDHAGDERRDHRRHVVDRLVRADGGAVLLDPSSGRRAHLRALSPRLRRGAADTRARSPPTHLAEPSGGRPESS